MSGLESILSFDGLIGFEFYLSGLVYQLSLRESGSGLAIMPQRDRFDHYSSGTWFIHSKCDVHSSWYMSGYNSCSRFRIFLKFGYCRSGLNCFLGSQSLLLWFFIFFVVFLRFSLFFCEIVVDAGGRKKARRKLLCSGFISSGFVILLSSGLLV